MLPDMDAHVPERTARDSRVEDRAAHSELDVGDRSVRHVHRCDSSRQDVEDADPGGPLGGQRDIAGPNARTHATPDCCVEIRNDQLPAVEGERGQLVVDVVRGDPSFDQRSRFVATGCGPEVEPPHHVVDIELVGCPDPEASWTRFFTPAGDPLAADPDAIGRRYIGALADEIAAWLAQLPDGAPIGVCFSGGIDSGAVFLLTEHLLRKLGMHPGRLKAFTLSLRGGVGADLAQAREFLATMGLEMYLESIEAEPGSLNPLEAVRVIEDYKPLDVESAAMTLALLRGIRARYPDWRHLVDGDGGDENLKDYPIEENPELTIRSVLHNSMLYQEGWGVGRMKHSATYSGGQSRSYSRTWAPLRRWGFEGFSPYTRPRVVETAEAIPFVTLTAYDHERLYALKGEIVSRGVAALTGRAMPVFPKRRFQDGGLPAGEPRPFRGGEAEYRSHFLSLYA